MATSAHCQIDWDPDHKILLVTLCGAISDPEFWSTYDMVAESVRTLAPTGAILDFSPATGLSLSTGLVQSLSCRAPLFSETAIKVAVAPRDLPFGLSRMYQLLSDKPNIHVVRTMDQAFEILRLSDTKFQPAQIAP